MLKDMSNLQEQAIGLLKLRDWVDLRIGPTGHGLKRKTKIQVENEGKCVPREGVTQHTD